MSLKNNDIDRAWNKLGMEITDSNDRHAKLYWDGKLILRTKRSLGSGKLDGQIPFLIRQQMKLDKKQFQDLIDCPLKLDGYLDILRSKGFLPGSSNQ